MVDCSLEMQLQRDMAIENNQATPSQRVDSLDCDEQEMAHLANKEVKKEILKSLSDFVELVLPTMTEEERVEKERQEQEKAEPKIQRPRGGLIHL